MRSRTDFGVPNGKRLQTPDARVDPFELEQFYRQHLSPGEFDLSASSPVPLTIRECFEAAGLEPNLYDLPLAYEVGGGSDALKAAVAGLYNNVRPDDVLITAGALEAIRAAAAAAVAPGTTVAVQTPSYAALRRAAIDAGGRPLPWQPKPGGFRFDLADLFAGETDAPDVAFANTPHGPSGSLLGEGARYEGLLVADEVYRPIELVSGTAPPSLVETHERAIVIGDLSKPLGLGGLRIGWLVCRDHALLSQCAAALDYLSGSVSAPSARVATVALQSFPALLQSRLEPARRNLSALAAFIEQHCGRLDWTQPQAGFTALVHLENGEPDDAWFQELRAQGVFLLPGRLFGCHDWLRIGFGGDEAAFRKALSILGKALPTRTGAAPPLEDPGDVILFTKAPRPGVAKTRLTAAIGEAMTGRVAAAFLADTVAFCRARSRQLYVSYTPEEAGAEMTALVSGVIALPQRGELFGARLASAFEAAFSHGARNPLLVGSDSPSLPSHLLTSGHRALRHNDLVVGPAEDGGFYAIGMRREQPRLFDGIDWSTDIVLEQLRSNAARLGLSIFWLPYWYDVDSAADLARLREDPLLGPATARAMRSFYGS